MNLFSCKCRYDIGDLPIYLQATHFVLGVKLIDVGYPFDYNDCDFLVSFWDVEGFACSAIKAKPHYEIVFLCDLIGFGINWRSGKSTFRTT